MRTGFHDQLAALTGELANGCGLVGAAIADATDALLQANLVKAEEVIASHRHVAAMSTHATGQAYSLLALQAPVAGDLRQIVGAIQIVADVQRMGALAVHVAKIARRRHPEHALPQHVRGIFAEMGGVSVELASLAQQSLAGRDPHTAARIDHDDDAMDDLHRHLFSVLIDRGWQHGVASAVDITLLGRFYERFADHAVEVGHRVRFEVTGHRPAT